MLYCTRTYYCTIVSNYCDIYHVLILQSISSTSFFRIYGLYKMGPFVCIKDFRKLFRNTKKCYDVELLIYTISIILFRQMKRESSGTHDAQSRQ